MCFGIGKMYLKKNKIKVPNNYARTVFYEGFHKKLFNTFLNVTFCCGVQKIFKLKVFPPKEINSYC